MRMMEGIFAPEAPTGMAGSLRWPGERRPWPEDVPGDGGRSEAEEEEEQEEGCW